MTALAAASSGSDPGSALAGFAFIFGGIFAWWLPTIIAIARKVPNIGSVAVIDGLLSWTVVGWIVALAMACRSRPPQPPAFYQPPPQVPPGGMR
jgi:hypothetical protein